MSKTGSKRTAAQVRYAEMMPDIMAGKLSHAEIATKHGTSKTSVARASDQIKAQVLGQQQAAIQKLRDNVVPAVERLLRLTKSKNQQVALKAIVALLDRAGVPRVEKLEHSGSFRVALGELAEETRRALARRRARAHRGKDEDVAEDEEVGDERTEDQA